MKLFFLLIPLILFSTVEVILAEEILGGMEQVEASGDAVGFWDEPSKDARKRQHFGIVTEQFYSRYINGYWLVSSKYQIGAYYHDDFTISFASSHNVNIKGSEKLVYGQFYAGNSFYIIAGFGKREVWSDTETYEETESGDKVYEKCRISGEGNIVSVGIGNQWTFKFFTIGGRWYAQERPVTAPQVKDNCTYRTSTEERSVEEEKQEVKKYGFREPNFFIVPIIYIGVQF